MILLLMVCLLRGENNKAPRLYLGALNPAERTESPEVFPRSFEPISPAERTESPEVFPQSFEPISPAERTESPEVFPRSFEPISPAERTESPEVFPRSFEPISPAERTGFEPANRFCRLHAFQACLFNHSSTSPNLRLQNYK